MPEKKHHYASLHQLALEITRLLDLICQGNGRSEHVIGLRKIGTRRIRLILRAEVVDAGANPLQTHGTLHAADSIAGDSNALGGEAECIKSDSVNH